VSELQKGGHPDVIEILLDRPVFAWVIAIVIMALGGLAIYNLPISQYPPIAPPSIAIYASYPGASAQTVENSVTQIIEQKLTGLDRLLYMSATSDSAGGTRIELTFEREPIRISPGPRCRTNSSSLFKACLTWSRTGGSRSANLPGTT